MHVKGAGACGTFAVTQDSSRYTRAETFPTIGMQTLMLARFRRSPIRVVRQKPLDNAARQIVGVSKNILQR
ncbi:catalase [Burkholderia lata]|uniref:Catalase n=1 Tax=Burkholderia lata (strain ATCC 17760 / DSM 23089 / LMG 22485 / NCIMB 9086 / R18194 / 383) TaxID=482957 RepID=A0A6P2RZ98_BURL3|nr:Catalase [Burkholderia lata]